MTDAVTPLLFRTPHDLIYDYALSSAYRSAWVYDPSFALSREPDVWEIVRRDAGFLASIERHGRNVVRDWHVEPPKKSKDEKSKQLSGVVEDAVGQCRKFGEARRILSEAAFLGRRYAFIASERMTLKLDGTQPMEWLVPVFLQDVDRRRVHWVPEYGRTEEGRPTLSTRMSLYNTVTGLWEELMPEFRGQLIEYVFYAAEERVGYGRGWLEAIYFAHYMKTVTIQKLAEGIDRWANGIIKGSLDSLRNASVDRTNDEMNTRMRNALRDMRSEHIIVLGEGDDIEVIETSGTGYQMGEKFLAYWDNVVERLCNASVRPVGLGSEKGGARAATQEEAETSEAYYQDERDDMDDVIDRDLVSWFMRQPLNRMNLQRLGLADADRPKFNTRQEKKQDPETAGKIMNEALDHGQEVLRQDYYGKQGLTLPGPGEDTVKPPVQEGGDLGTGSQKNAGQNDQRRGNNGGSSGDRGRKSA